MPIYEYECQACGHRFEEWQKMSDEPIKVCPTCAAPKVEKLISHSSFQLKGGGWYSDLYASKKPAGGSGGSSESAPASSASGGNPAPSSAPSSKSGSSGGGKGSGGNGVKAA